MVATAASIVFGSDRGFFIAVTASEVSFDVLRRLLSQAAHLCSQSPAVAFCMQRRAGKNRCKTSLQHLCCIRARRPRRAINRGASERGRTAEGARNGSARCNGRIARSFLAATGFVIAATASEVSFDAVSSSLYHRQELISALDLRLCFLQRAQRQENQLQNEFAASAESDACRGTAIDRGASESGHRQWRIDLGARNGAVLDFGGATSP